MKVNQVVGEHAKGMRAKKYAKKPTGTIAPKKPEAPKAAEKQGVAEGMFGLSAKEKGAIMNVTAKISDIPGNWDHKNQQYTEQGLKDLKSVMKNEKYLKYALSLTADDYEADMEEELGSMTNTSGKIIANDGKTITVAMPDGTQIQKPITPDTIATDPQGKPVVNLATQPTAGGTQPTQNPQDMFAKGKDVTINTGTPVKEDELSDILRAAGVK